MKCGPNIGSGCGGRGWNEKEKEKETEQGREREKKRQNGEREKMNKSLRVERSEMRREFRRITDNGPPLPGFYWFAVLFVPFSFPVLFLFPFFFLFIPFDFGLALACRFIKSVRSCEIAGFIKKKKDQTQFYLVLPSLTEFCLVLQIFYRRFSWFLRAVTVFYLVLPSFTQFYPVLPSFTEI